MNPTSSPSGAPSSIAASNTSPASAAAGEVDVRALAEKVYRLLLADLSLEMRRSGRTGRGETGRGEQP